MDWNNPAHVLQALFWGFAVAMFFFGYRVGDRL